MDHFTELGFTSGVAEHTGVTTPPTPAFLRTSSSGAGAQGFHTDPAPKTWRELSRRFPAPMTPTATTTTNAHNSEQVV